MEEQLKKECHGWASKPAECLMWAGPQTGRPLLQGLRGGLAESAHGGRESLKGSEQGHE